MGVFLVALATAATASAAGGTKIASAPLLRPGVAQTVDTNGDVTRRGKVGSETSAGCWVDYEYFRLALKAGDRVAISGTNAGSGLNFAVGVFPAGTTDATLHGARSLVNAEPAEATVHFTARANGIYPLVIGPSCYDGMDGTFQFLVRITPGG